MRRKLWSWALYDWANNGFFTPIQTFVFAAYFARSVAESPETGTALWGNMLGAAGLIVGLGGPLLGAVADQSGRRKPWIAAFTLLCAVPTVLLWFVLPDPSWIWPALILVCLGTIGGEAAMIFYNAMLPDLVPPERMGRWSGWGWGMGYVGGLLCLLLALYGFINENPWFALPRAAAEHVRIIGPLGAAWYLVFALPLFLWTPDAPSKGRALGACVRSALAQIRDSVRDVRSHRHIVRFLLARMLYNDGLATMFAFGGIYAAGTFGMTPKEVILFGIGLNVTAGLGAGLFAWLDDRVGARATILVSLAGLILPGVVILLTESRTVFWIFGLLLGIFVGPVQASSRSWLARTAPGELRAQMFGLFALSGKLTSFAGPLLVGWVTLLAGSQRWGMSTVIMMYILGALVMLGVPRAADIRPPVQTKE
ncbi:MFS transporter [Paucidesulfovibrio longus]|uniref:MFS transporter n=1 Tax=Paucidesulfovibrio longus TaxID=889 RepID=UPI0003B6A7A0|nr:MFS transporter [Paucidesulfovibrio longus]